jgi:tight adherence protein B
MTAFAGALLGLIFAAGVLAAIVGLTRRTVTPSKLRAESFATKQSGIDPAQLRLIGVALSAGFFLGVLTGWFAPALVFGGLVWLVPHTIQTRAAVRRDRERLRSLASWIEVIRDLLGSGAGIEDALVASQRHTGAPIAVDVAQLVIDTQVKGSRVALLAFGESFANPVADEVVWALTIAMERSSASVSEVMSKAASRARERVATQERIDAKRSSRYSVVNAMVVMTVLLGAALISLNPAYRVYYATTGGQLVLAAVLFMQGAGFVTLLRMSRHQAGFRLPVSDDPIARLGLLG